MYLPRVGIEHLLNVAVVRRDQAFAPGLPHRVYHPLQALIQRFDGLYRRV